MARLCVLLEDLRIELVGFHLPDLGARENTSPASELDQGGHKLRKIYFLRRSIGTCWEFAESVRLLNETTAFNEILSDLPVSMRSEWNECIAYFRDHERFWREIRNDVGGHFGSKASEFAVENFPQDCNGSFEAQLGSRRQVAFIFGFAAEIAATALLRNLPGVQNEEKAGYLREQIVHAYGNAIIATRIIAIPLWDRAESS